MFVLWQVLKIEIRDSHLTGHPDVGFVEFPLRNLVDGEVLSKLWLPVEPANPGQVKEGALLLDISYKVLIRTVHCQLPSSFLVDLTVSGVFDAIRSIETS